MAVFVCSSACCFSLLIDCSASHSSVSRAGGPRRSEGPQQQQQQLSREGRREEEEIEEARKQWSKNKIEAGHVVKLSIFPQNKTRLLISSKSINIKDFLKQGGGGRRIRQCVITVMCVINGFNNRWTEGKKNRIYNNPHPFLIAYHY